MPNRVILVSDDSDFFEYVTPKLKLRNCDELYKFDFKELPEKLGILLSSVIIINSEKSEDKTLELLSLIKNSPSIVFSYNNDSNFELECLKAGCNSYITFFTPQEEFDAKMLSVLNILSNIKKQNMYRNILVENNLLISNNEVFLNYNNILDYELKNNNDSTSVLAAIAPNDKTKFLLKANQIETIILSNIRQSDILMNYAPNKYFLLLKDIDITKAQKIWEKIQQTFPEKIYAGFAQTGRKQREQLVNEALNKLHESINKDYYKLNDKTQNPIENYKIFRKKFNENMEKVITPAFYHIVQKYGNKYLGINITHKIDSGCGIINVKSRYMQGLFKVTGPGGAKINIDISYNLTNEQQNKPNYPAEKRITLEPEEFEASVLEDILEQFITEFKNEVANEYT